LQGNVARSQRSDGNLLRRLNIDQARTCNGQQLTRGTQRTNHQITRKGLDGGENGGFDNGRLSVRLEQLQ
jgi:hypothetical protein